MKSDRIRRTRKKNVNKPITNTEKYIAKVWKSINIYQSYIPTKEEMNEVMSEVYDEPDFKRQIKETSGNLGHSEELVRAVVEHYFSTLAEQFTHTWYGAKVRIMIHGFFKLQFFNRVNFNFGNKEVYRNKGLSEETITELFSIFKNQEDVK